MSIQTLVADENLDQANALAQEGLETYPENEGVLAITSLLAIVRNEWDRAVVLLDRLIAIQGDRASDFTRMMYERARTCRSGVSSDGQTVTASPATDA